MAYVPAASDYNPGKTHGQVMSLAANGLSRQPRIARRNQRGNWLMWYSPDIAFSRFCRALFAFTYIKGRHGQNQWREEHIKMCNAIVAYNKKQGRTADAQRLDYLMRRIHCQPCERMTNAANCVCANRDGVGGCPDYGRYFDMTLDLGFERNRMAERRVLVEEARILYARDKAEEWLERSCNADPLPYEPWTCQLIPSDEESEQSSSMEDTAVDNATTTDDTTDDTTDSNTDNTTPDIATPITLASEDHLRSGQPRKVDKLQEQWAAVVPMKWPALGSSPENVVPAVNNINTTAATAPRFTYAAMAAKAVRARTTTELSATKASNAHNVIVS